MDINKLIKASKGYTRCGGGLNIKEIRKFIAIHINFNLKQSNLKRVDYNKILKEYLLKTNNKIINLKKRNCELCLLSEIETKAVERCLVCNKIYCRNCCNGCGGECAFCKDKNLWISKEGKERVKKEQEEKKREQIRRDREMASRDTFSLDFIILEISERSFVFFSIVFGLGRILMFRED